MDSNAPPSCPASPVVRACGRHSATLLGVWPAARRSGRGLDGRERPGSGVAADRRPGLTLPSPIAGMPRGLADQWRAGHFGEMEATRSYWWSELRSHSMAKSDARAFGMDRWRRGMTGSTRTSPALMSRWTWEFEPDSFTARAAERRIEHSSGTTKLMFAESAVSRSLAVVIGVRGHCLLGPWTATLGVDTRPDQRQTGHSLQGNHTHPELTANCPTSWRRTGQDLAGPFTVTGLGPAGRGMPMNLSYLCREFRDSRCRSFLLVTMPGERR